MSTISIDRGNLKQHMDTIQHLVTQGYDVTVHINSPEEPLSTYLKSGIHTDDTFGPFSDADTLIASLRK